MAGIVILTVALAAASGPLGGAPSRATLTAHRATGSNSTGERALDLPATSEARRADAGAPRHLEIHGGSAAQRATVTWAVQRFHEVGLELPLPTLYLHRGRARCDGGGGLSRIGLDGVVVHICDDGGGDLTRRVLHELAHVWDFAAGGIPDSTRARFLALRGLEAWNDASADWARQGAEHAAEIIAWGLRDGVAPIPTRVARFGPNDLQSLADAFVLLVGVPPPWLAEVDRLRVVRSNGSWQDV